MWCLFKVGIMIYVVTLILGMVHVNFKHAHYFLFMVVAFRFWNWHSRCLVPQREISRTQMYLSSGMNIRDSVGVKYIWNNSHENCGGRWKWRKKSRIPLKPWFFQASSFQLLKLENLLLWSFFTFKRFNCYHWVPKHDRLGSLQGAPWLSLPQLSRPFI